MANTGNITKDEIENGYKGYMTVADLKEFIIQQNIPDTAKVMVQRVEDRYFNENAWKTYKKYSGWIEDEEEYVVAWCPVKYSDEDNLLFIDVHY